MMKKTEIKKSAAYTIDLTAIEGDGSFPCPKCATEISPEDESEKVYKIVETKVVNNELVELLVLCAKCGSTIKLQGFQQVLAGLPNE